MGKELFSDWGMGFPLRQSSEDRAKDRLGPSSSVWSPECPPLQGHSVKITKSAPLRITLTFVRQPCILFFSAHICISVYIYTHT